MSYRELDEKSNQLANTLIAHGAKQQDRVAIFLHKSLELGVAIYGILKAGCIFVPIDPFIPKDRLSFIIQDCDISHTICSDELLEPLCAACKNPNGVLRMSVYGAHPTNATANTTSWPDIYTQNTKRPVLSLIDQDLGYIMYTSGSTGVPKGMMHSHSGSITYARWGASHVSLTSEDRVASHAPLHFDLSVFDFFSTARAGATVVLVPEAVTRFPASWTQTIESERISVVFTVPYTLTTMLEQGAMDKRDLTSLRWILYGGEPFQPKMLRRLMQKLKDVRFTNVYGPAEAPSCTCHNVNIPDDGNDDPISIGTVSRNSSDIILNDQDNKCEHGEAGELCIRSSSLTHGYWNRPDLNATAYFLEPGFGPFPKVYFRTGDRVVRRADGNLHFLGRVDRMVKIRGQRVELDEVESVLSSHPSVIEAAAFTVKDDADNQTVLAVVTVKSTHGTNSAELLRYARTKLSSYAVPLDLEIRGDLPHNSSGKIDRKMISEQWNTHKGA